MSQGSHSMQTVPALSAAEAGQLRALAEAQRQRPGPLLEILHAIQVRFGYVPAEAVPMLADVLNLSRAEVHGTLTFYPYYRSTPPGRHTLRLCRAEACQAMRGRELEQHVKARLGIDFHETSADGAISLEPVFCLGNCACAPAAMLDETLHGRLTPALIDAVIASAGGQTP